MSKASFWGVLIIAGLFILIIFFRNRFQNDLKRNGIIVNAKIIKVNIAGKGSGGFQCSFDLNGKTFEEPTPSTIRSNRYEFIGKRFPAIYSSKYETLEILIAPKDFEKFNIPFPDSLNWVLKYVIEN